MVEQRPATADGEDWEDAGMRGIRGGARCRWRWVAVVALGAIVSSLPIGLLGTPDMHVTGHNSFGTELGWFADSSTSLSFSRPVCGCIPPFAATISLWART